MNGDFKFSVMMRCLLYACYLFVPFCSIAQQDQTQYYNEKWAACGGVDSVMGRKGSWKRIADSEVFPDNSFPRSQFGQARARMDKVFPLFKEAVPDLGGLEPQWYRAIRGNSYIANGPVPYAFTSLYFDHYCNTNLNKLMVAGETGTWAYVFFNSLNWFCDQVDSWDIQENGQLITIYELPPKMGKWKGATLYQPQTHGKTCLAVVIGHEGKTPWFTLSRKQYLTGLRISLEKKKRESLEHFETYEEKSRQTFAKIKNLPPEQLEKLRQQHEETLKSFREKKETNIANTEKYYDETLHPIRDYLANKTEEALNEPAIIDPRAGIYGFRGEFGDEEKGGKRLIALTAKYYKPELPRYVPQFMVLYWRWTGSLQSLHFKKQFEERFPLEKLKELIDK